MKIPSETKFEHPVIVPLPFPLPSKKMFQMVEILSTGWSRFSPSSSPELAFVMCYDEEKKKYFSYVMPLISELICQV